MPYLIVEGAASFIRFVTDVFGAELISRHARDEDPDLVMHAEISINGSTIMCADATAQYPPQVAGLFVYVQDADAVFKKALAAGAAVVTELADQSYGRSGGVKDPTGNTWWITAARI